MFSWPIAKAAITSCQSCLSYVKYVAYTLRFLVICACLLCYLYAGCASCLIRCVMAKKVGSYIGYTQGVLTLFIINSNITIRIPAVFSFCFHSFNKIYSLFYMPMSVNWHFKHTQDIPHLFHVAYTYYLVNCGYEGPTQSPLFFWCCLC